MTGFPSKEAIAASENTSSSERCTVTILSASLPDRLISLPRYFLKDGREAAIVEAFENKVFIADVGNSPKDWD